MSTKDIVLPVGALDHAGLQGYLRAVVDGARALAGPQAVPPQTNHGRSAMG